MLLQLVTQELSLNVCFLYILSIVPNEINKWMKKSQLHEDMDISQHCRSCSGHCWEGACWAGRQIGMGFVFCVAHTGERLQPSCFRDSHVFSDGFDTALSWCTLFIEKIMASYACIQIFRKCCIFIASLWRTDSCIWHKTCTVTMFGTPTPNVFCWKKGPCAVLSLPLPVFRLLPSLPWNSGVPGISHSHSYFSRQHSIVRTYLSKTLFSTSYQKKSFKDFLFFLLK